jgi:integrase
MAVLDDVIVFAENLRPKKFSDKLKADKIKQFILSKNISNAYKSSLISNIKKYLIPTNYFKNNDTYTLMNAPDLYDEVFKQRRKKLDEDNFVKNVSIKDVELLLSFNKFTDDPYKLMTWLLVSSGMRLNELIDNHIEILCIDKIKVKFISKKSNDLNDYIIHLIVPSNEWVAVFNQFQNIIKNNNLTNPNTLSKGVKRVLLSNKISTDDVSLSAHSLRKLYLTYQIEIKNFEPDKLPSLKTKKLLNHSNENAGAFYTGAIKITGDLKDVVKDNSKYNKMKITDIKKILDDCSIKYKSNMKKNELIALIPV